MQGCCFIAIICQIANLLKAGKTMEVVADSLAFISTDNFKFFRQYRSDVHVELISKKMDIVLND